MAVEVDSAVLTNEQRQSFERDGFIVARQLLSPEQVAEIRDTFMEMARNGPVENLSESVLRWTTEVAHYDPAEPLAFYPRMLLPHTHMDKPVGPVAKKYMLYPAIGVILRELMGEEPLAAQSMFYFKPPGARGQDLHQDNFYLKVRPGTCMAAWIAVDDADEENGGMMCVPNTQAYPIQCPEKADPNKSFTSDHVEPPAGLKPQIVRLAAGDVLFFNGNVIHGSHPNTSKTRFRRALICHYMPRSSISVSGWYRGPMDFKGDAVSMEFVDAGGPCGNAQEMPSSPH